MSLKMSRRRRVARQSVRRREIIQVSAAATPPYATGRSCYCRLFCGRRRSLLHLFIVVFIIIRFGREVDCRVALPSDTARRATPVPSDALCRAPRPRTSSASGERWAVIVRARFQSAKAHERLLWPGAAVFPGQRPHRRPILGGGPGPRRRRLPRNFEPRRRWRSSMAPPPNSQLDTISHTLV